MSELIEKRECECSRELCVIEKLRRLGFSCTPKRMALVKLICDGPHRHFSVEDLYQEALEVNLRISLATVYNTLNHFRKIGLVRELSIGSGTSVFDTNVSDHAHFYIEEGKKIIDIPSGAVTITKFPEAPSGMEITRFDIMFYTSATP